MDSIRKLFARVSKKHRQQILTVARCVKGRIDALDTT
jgi:hypothetical protein